MADPNDLIRAREALVAPGDALDPKVLGAVHDGLLRVPAEPGDPSPRAERDGTHLSLRPVHGR